MTENQDFGCGKVWQSPRMVHGVVLWDTQGLPHIAAPFYDFYGRFLAFSGFEAKND